MSHQPAGRGRTMRILPLLSWMLFPGCWAAVRVLGPGTVRGPPGGSVTVRCRYEPGYETYPKYWCRAGSGAWSCSGDPLAESDGTEAEARRGRVSIRDNRTQRVFAVTVESLTRADTGTYRCGIWRAVSDHMDTVTVLVSPEDPTPTLTGRPQSRPDQAESTFHRTTAEERQPSSSTNQYTTSPGSQLSNVYFLLLVLWKVPVFLCIMGVNVWYTKNLERDQADMVGTSTLHTLNSQL